ncbi:hypothetical protein [uncultured Mediterranean phage uvDeep-CGR2-KM19-C37]|nr:hypothetical protein [uncultured Mediterranean phage uvDeep-CGR2-KM19-C37]
MATLTADSALGAEGYQQITAVDNATAQGLTVGGVGTRALIEVQDADVRWRDDGSDPTATVGMRLAAGDSLWYNGADLTAIKFISQSGTDAILNVSYYSVRQ